MSSFVCFASRSPGASKFGAGYLNATAVGAGVFVGTTGGSGLTATVFVGSGVLVGVSVSVAVTVPNGVKVASGVMLGSMDTIFVGSDSLVAVTTTTMTRSVWVGTGVGRVPLVAEEQPANKSANGMKSKDRRLTLRIGVSSTAIGQPESQPGTDPSACHSLTPCQSADLYCRQTRPKL